VNEPYGQRVNAANPTGPPTLDGRTARSARTRDAVVRALLGLISEGDVRPTAGRIAERAGISLRSVYVHFDDLDDLFLAAAAEQRGRVFALTRKLPDTGPFEIRLIAFVEQRARVLEAIAAVAKAAALQEPFSPAIAATTTAAREFGRAELQSVFAIELANLDPMLRDHALDACDTLTAADSWDFLRVRRKLSPQAAAATLATSLRLLLQPEANATVRQHARRWRARPPALPADSGGQERR
jgi:TetR/AcrR family transcriptional regulator, regulator of autoinduction and epiphytic fitness